MDLKGARDKGMMSIFPCPESTLGKIAPPFKKTMSNIQNIICMETIKEVEDELEAKKKAESGESELCELCEGQGWYWLGALDNMWKEKCECGGEPVDDDDDS